LRPERSTNDLSSSWPPPQVRQGRGTTAMIDVCLSRGYCTLQTRAGPGPVRPAGAGANGRVRPPRTTAASAERWRLARRLRIQEVRAVPEDQPVAFDRDRYQVVAECPAMIRPPPPEVPAGPQELPTFLPPHRLLGSAPEGAALRPHFHDDQPAIVLDHQVDFPGAVAHVP